MTETPYNREWLNQALENAQRIIRDCLKTADDDPSATSIRYIADAFPLERPFEPTVFNYELRELLDPDLRDHLPTEDSPEFDREAFTQITLAQVTRDMGKLLSGADRLPGYRDSSSLVARILDGKIADDPCSEPQLPEILNVRSWTSVQGIERSHWTPGTAPFGAMTNLGSTLGSLSGLTSTQPVAIRLSNQTSLIGTLSGSNLQAEFGVGAVHGLEEATQQFFRQYARALTGFDENWGVPRRTSDRVVQMRQTSDYEVPVYGGVMVASYDREERLAFVKNTCYPMPAQQFTHRFIRSRADAIEIAVGFIERDLLGQAGNTKETVLEAFPGDDFFAQDDDRAGRVILPVLLRDGKVFTAETLDPADVEGTTADYLPAWALWVVERNSGRCWKVLVDAEPSDERNPVFAAFEEGSGASVSGAVAPTVAHALGLNGLGPVDMILIQTLDGTLGQAPDFQLPSNAPVPDRLVNLYYHLTQCRKEFDSIRQFAWPNTANLPPLPDRASNWTIALPNVEGDAGYSYSSVVKRITFPNGCPNGCVNAPGPAFTDPASDPEVIYHEYAHAVVAELQPDLHNGGNSIFRGAIDEGLAYYFACSLSDRLLNKLAPQAAGIEPSHRWGKVSRRNAGWLDHAYRDLERWQTQNGQTARQRPDHDYMTAYGIFPGFAAGLDEPGNSKKYAVGMLWARTLWDIRQLLGAEWADAMILRAIHIAGGVQSDLETPAEAIIHVDQLLAQERGGPTHTNALRLIFASRGIFADSPIRAITPLMVGAGQALLAATESPLNDETACGCLISLDQGNLWQSLGQNGPRDVTALCWLPGPPNQAIVWAVGESSLTPQGTSPSQVIFRYDLSFDNNGNPLNLNDAWIPLSPLLTNAAIRCLAATPADPANPTGPAWLFAGAENGIYKYDGAKWPVNALPTVEVDDLDFAILDLKVVENQNGQRRLVAATASTVDIYDIAPIPLTNPNDVTALVMRTQQPAPAVSVHSDAPVGSQLTNTVWIGTRNEGLLETNPFDDDPELAESAGAWPDANRPKPATFALARDTSAAQPTFLAGTNHGIFRRVGNAGWQAVAAGAPELQNVSVLALWQADGRWLLGTAQRGLWLCDLQNNSAVRVVGSVGRLGANEPLPQTPCAGFVGFSLAANETRTHVVTVLEPPAGSLRFTVRTQPDGGLARVAFLRASLGIDLHADPPRPAGVQHIRTLTQPTSGKYELDLPSNSPAGYYVVAVQAGAFAVCYDLHTNL